MCKFFQVLNTHFLYVNFFLEQEVQRLEVLCKQLYESQDAAARSEAEKALVTFQNSGDRYILKFRIIFLNCYIFIKFFVFSLTKCQMLLDRQNSPYSQLLATTTLTKLISRTAQVLSLQQRIDIRKFYQIIFFFILKF